MKPLEIKEKVTNFFERPNVDILGDSSVILPFIKIDSFWILQKTFPSLKSPIEVKNELCFKGIDVQSLANNITFCQGSPDTQRWTCLSPGSQIIDDSMTIIKGSEVQFDSNSFVRINSDIKSSSQPVLYCSIQLENRADSTTYKFEGKALNGEGDYGIIQDAINSIQNGKIPISLLIDGGLRRNLESNGFIVLGIEGILEISIFKKILNFKKSLDIHKKLLEQNNRLYTRDFRNFHTKEAFKKTWLRLYNLFLNKVN